MHPGDVIIHNILVLHGSPAAQSHLRRVIYYEFRPAEVELAIGPHTPEYIPLKQHLLLACLRDRRRHRMCRTSSTLSTRQARSLHHHRLPQPNHCRRIATNISSTSGIDVR
jgi:hypothetical protein